MFLCNIVNAKWIHPIKPDITCNVVLVSTFFHDTQTDEQKALWQQILDIVNKTNLIDYTMDIRMRLQLGDKMPDVSARHESKSINWTLRLCKPIIWFLFALQELAARKAKVLETLIQLQNEVAPITNITEKLKDSDNIKDSKAFVQEIQQEFGVSFWPKQSTHIACAPH